MNLAELNKVAEAMVAPGRGILAADESTSTIKKRFDAIGVESTADTPARLPRNDVPHHRSDVEAHFRCHPLRRDHPPERQGRHAAGEGDRAGRRAARHQGRQRHQAAALCPGEVVTEGLDGLRERLAEYREPRRQIRQVARGDRHRPGHPDLRRICGERARPRALRRAVPGRGIVPIVEPEVLMDGDHDIERCAQVSRGCSRPCSSSCTFCACRSKAWCSSRTWSCPARSRRSGRRSRRSRRRRCASSRPASPPPCRVSRSCPAASPTRKRPRISTPLTGSAPCPGTSPSRTAARCRPAAESLGRQNGEHRRRAARLRPPRPMNSLAARGRGRPSWSGKPHDVSVLRRETGGRRGRHDHPGRASGSIWSRPRSAIRRRSCGCSSRRWMPATSPLCCCGSRTATSAR